MLFLPGAVLFTINLGWALREVNAGNTVCTSNHTDWYTSVIGETPCTTYERLRQMCNGAYQVGTLTRNTPPDYCDDQVKDCCCNSISFSLSMLCLACQNNTADGFDAGVGAYQQYLMQDGKNTCNPRTDQNFTTLIQDAVCNTGIKIEDQLYNLFWADGQWFYAYTRDSIIRNHAAYSNKTQTRCATTTTSSTSLSASKTALSTAPPSSTGSGKGDDSADNDSQLATGTIAGIVTGVVAIVALLTIVFILVSRRRRVRTAAALPEIDPYTSSVLGTANSGYIPLGQTSAGYLSDRDTRTGIAISAAPVPPIQKRDRKQRRQDNAYPLISYTNMSASGSGSGSTPQGSSTAGGLNPVTLAWPMGRHTDGGPAPAADLGRSESGRLPPAYGEQLVAVEPASQATEIRQQVHLTYIPPEERQSQLAQLSHSEWNGSDGTSMREVGDNPQPSTSALVPRRKE